MMDVETAEAIDGVRSDIRRVERQLTDTETSLRRDMRELGTALREEFRREIHEAAVETRRHVDILFESLRDDVRLVAEGLVTLDAKVDRLTGSGPR